MLWNHVNLQGFTNQFIFPNAQIEARIYSKPKHILRKKVTFGYLDTHFYSNFDFSILTAI